MDDGNGAEEEVGDVSENGSAACGDEVGGEEFVEFVEGVVDAHGGGEFVAVGGEALEEVGVWAEGEMRGGMFGTEAGVLSRLAAVASRRATVETLQRRNR